MKQIGFVQPEGVGVSPGEFRDLSNQRTAKENPIHRPGAFGADSATIRSRKENAAKSKNDSADTMGDALLLHRWALGQRSIYLWGQVDDDSARWIIERMHYLSGQSSDESRFYIHSPGGATHSGMAIIDTMESIECDVRTICLGLAASFGAMLLMCGSEGKRHCMPHSKIMIHQPHVPGQYQSVASDLRIFADSVTREREELNRIIARKTGQPIATVESDTDRDRWIYAEEAVEYGIVDSVISRLPID